MHDDQDISEPAEGASRALHPLLAALNPAQQRAVQATQGPVLILAGAGSGKTRTLTHRIAYMIEVEGISPYEIMAVTFTNKAANEMKKRIVTLLHGPERAEAILESLKGQGVGFHRNDLPVVGTFHAVCVQILRKYGHLLGFENRFAIYDDTDSQVLMKTIMKERGIPKDKLNPKAVLAHIAGAKNRLLTPDEFSRQAHTFFSEKVAELYPIYQRRLGNNQALDFEDIIMKTVQLLQSEPRVLEELQDRFRYLSVDEYQDTNHAQYVLVRLLASKYRNLCVVGDDWQSIYSWRGATMQNILDFEKDYSDTLVIKLEQNYRSTSHILDASHAVIARNKRKTDKKLWTDRDGGEKVKIWQALDERDEGAMIAREIQRVLLMYEHPDYRDFAVLYRTNAQSRVVEEAMMRYAIPYRVVGGVKFYQRKEIKDVLAYLRLIVNPADTVSLMRIINTPPRKIGTKTMETLQDLSRQRGDEPLLAVMEAIGKIDEANSGVGSGGGSEGRSDGDSGHSEEASTAPPAKVDLPFSESKTKTLKQFVTLIAELQKVNHKYPASGVIKHLLELSGYKSFLLDGSPEGDARYENVQELISVASKYDLLEPGISLVTFLEEVSLISDLDRIDDQDNAVTLMTMHSAKGLEFSNVFLCGLEEGIFPHSRSLLEPNELEEERRLMYVGLTRAMERSYLLYAEKRMLYGEVRRNAPSQFLNDLPEDSVEYGGAAVRRAKRGSGFRKPTGSRRIPVENASGFYPDEEPRYDGVDELPEARREAPGLSGQPENRHPHGESDDVQTPSPEFEIDYHAGDRVRHRKFGEGVVVSVTGGILTIAFKDPRVGVKKLAASVAPLEKLC